MSGNYGPTPLSLNVDQRDASDWIKSMGSQLRAEYSRANSNSAAASSPSSSSFFSFASPLSTPRSSSSSTKRLYRGPYLHQLTLDHARADPKPWSAVFGDPDDWSLLYGPPLSWRDPWPCIRDRIEENVARFLPNYLRFIVFMFALFSLRQPLSVVGLTGFLLLSDLARRLQSLIHHRTTVQHLAPSSKHHAALFLTYILMVLVSTRLKAMSLVSRALLWGSFLAVMHACVRRGSEETSRVRKARHRAANVGRMNPLDAFVSFLFKRKEVAPVVATRGEAWVRFKNKCKIKCKSLIDQLAKAMDMLETELPPNGAR